MKIRIVYVFFHIKYRCDYLKVVWDAIWILMPNAKCDKNKYKREKIENSFKMNVQIKYIYVCLYAFIRRNVIASVRLSACLEYKLFVWPERLWTNPHFVLNLMDYVYQTAE